MAEPTGQQAGGQPRGRDFAAVDAVGVQSRDDAKAWIIKNQLGRRNVSESIRAVLATSLETIYAKRAKTRQLAAQNNDAGRAVVANLPQQATARVPEGGELGGQSPAEGTANLPPLETA